MLLLCNKAIEKGDIPVEGKYDYWRQDIHEQVTGGKLVFLFDGGDPQKKSPKNMEAMMQLLEYAPRAHWSTEKPQGGAAN